MPLTVFVSHSTNKGPEDQDDLVTPGHRLFLDDLCKRLDGFEEPAGQNPFRALVDKTHLNVGDPWRKRLIDGLGTCGAGIVLLNKKAITKSPWVLAEANILRWRDWREESFLLVLVALGDGSRQAFGDESKWKPLSFSEVQFLDGGTEFTGAAMPDAAFDDLVMALKKVAENAAEGEPRTRFEALERTVRRALERALPSDMQDRARTEARTLMEEGPKELHGVLTRLGDDLDPDGWLDVVEAIACWWIDPCSAASLAKAGDAKVRQLSFSLTGKLIRYTPRLYVRHASFLPPRLSWKVVDRITASSGQQKNAAFLEIVVGEVREDLKRVYQKAWDKNPDEVSDDDIKGVIRGNLELDPPVPTFVALPNHIAADVDVKAAILAAFPDLAFLHLTSDPAAARRIPDCEALEPLPKLEKEQKNHSHYTTARSRLSP